MKAFRTFFRSLRDAFKSVIRNFSLSLASISCLSITLIIIAISLIVSFNVQSIIKDIESEMTIVVFFNEELTSDTKKDFEDVLKSIDTIDTFEYVSKSDSRDLMYDEVPEYRSILDNLGNSENPMKDSYRIKVKDINKIKETSNKLETYDNIYDVKYGEDEVEPLIDLFNVVKKITYIVAASLIIVTIFLIINTIKLTIFSRQKEIFIMRLVGASNIRIKLPFVFEGIILGAIGSVVPILLVIYGYTTLYEKVGGIFISNVIKLIKPYPNVFYISFIVLLTGMFVGMIGSSRAVRRYIKL